MSIFDKNFTKIPNPILKDISISDGAFRTYSVLRSFSFNDGNVFPSIETIAKIRGKSKKTIIEHHKQLRSLGLLRYKRRGYSASNQYEFIGEEKYTNESNENELIDTSKVEPTTPQYLQNLQPNNTEIDNTEKNKLQGEALFNKIDEILKKHSFLRGKPKPSFNKETK